MDGSQMGLNFCKKTFCGFMHHLHASSKGKLVSPGKFSFHSNQEQQKQASKANFFFPKRLSGKRKTKADLYQQGTNST